MLITLRRKSSKERWPSGYGVTFRYDLNRDSSERGFESHPLHFATSPKMFAAKNWKIFLLRDLEPTKNDLFVSRTALQLVAFSSTSLDTFAWRKCILSIRAIKIPEMPDQEGIVVSIGIINWYDIP